MPSSPININPPSSPSSNNSNSNSNTTTFVLDFSGTNIFDICGNQLPDISLNIPPIVSITEQNTVDQTGLRIINTQGFDSSGNSAQTVEFISTQPDIYDPDITEHLVEIVEIVDDVSSPLSKNGEIVSQISVFASKIQCTDFQGKGTIDDYANLFEAACRIANETRHIELDVDIDGFNEFAKAAEDLSKLFVNFTRKLQNVNIINDSVFLSAVLNALEKIYNLSEAFGKFKETVIMTTTIQLPKSIKDTSVIVQGVMTELDCAMDYITNFVNPISPPPPGSELSVIEKNIISQAVSTIDSWNVICEQGVSIAMSSNTDIQYIQRANVSLKQKTVILNSVTTTLRTKLSNYLVC
jgi:hypothetical protein